jgi:hypothetical protein
MANVKLLFYGTETSGTEEHTIECFNNTHDEIYIQVQMGNDFAFICLDKSTAIKFHRNLKRSISFLDKEVDNG